MGLYLRKEGHDGGACVAADDGNSLLVDVDAHSRGDEGASSHDVERRHAEEALGVVDALLFEHLVRVQGWSIRVLGLR